MWGDLWEKVTGAAGALADDWTDAVNRLKEKAREFTAVYSTLLNAREGLSGNDLARVDALLRRGNIVRSTIDGIARTVGGIAGLLPSKTLAGYARGGQLGALPLVSIAVILGAIAAITAWLSDAYVEIKRLNLAEEVHRAGGNPGVVLGDGFYISQRWLGVGAVVIGGFVLWRLARGKG